MSEDLLDPAHQTAIIFACRYTHHRETGAAYAMTQALALLWGKLSKRVQEQIEKEAKEEATTNWNDWADFFDWEANDIAEGRPSTTPPTP